MYKENVVDVHSGILLSYEKGWHLCCSLLSASLESSPALSGISRALASVKA
jgi:hypothetical protein